MLEVIWGTVLLVLGIPMAAAPKKTLQYLSSMNLVKVESPKAIRICGVILILLGIWFII